MGVLVPKFVPSRLHPHPAKPSLTLSVRNLRYACEQREHHLQIPLANFMIYEFSSHEAMIQAWAEDPGLPGPSPGGAASMLKITRQGVYQAVKRGSLDMIRLKEPGRPGPLLYITNASLERYKLNQGTGSTSWISATLNPCGRSYPQECLA